MLFFRKIEWLLWCNLLALTSFAQQKNDTVLSETPPVKPVSRFVNNIFQDAINSIKRDPGDTVRASEVLIAKSEQSFQRHEGKIIRDIYVKPYGFERTFNDTTNRINYYGTKILNALHINTKEWVIYQNLFVRKNSALNPYELADNERYLRTLEFIQDSRIFVVPVAGNNDSVDVLVIYKDLFTITGVLDVSSNSVKLRLAEVNFLGMAQRVQGTGLWEKNRNPGMGFEALYSKTNIGGSFVNGTIGYTQINTGRSDGTEDEKSFFIRIDRPLISPFSHVAGGAEISFNRSENFYSKPEVNFLDYQYNIYDGWIGYNVGTKRLLDNYNYNNKRNRVFVSVRYLKTEFVNAPEQVGDRFDPIYNDKRALLGQLTYFKQDFYKLNYLYGFGTTEDVPIGFNISATAGSYRHLHLARPYAGFQVKHYIVTPWGGFVESTFKAGGLRNKGFWQDAGILASVNFFTRVFFVHKWKLREFVKISYTQLNNRLTYEPLRINNTYGLNEFRTDSIEGNKRISAYAESVLYTDAKIFGFRFAPVVYGDFSLISYENLPFKKSDIFTGVGGGIRTRNENLVFGTIELKATYFPRPVHTENFRISLSSDIRFRYRSNFINPPNIIHLNRDDL